MNPNIFPYQQGSSEDKFNRANEINRSNDKVVVPKVTLYDIDYAVYYHLTQNLNIQINDNGTMIQIPCIFASAEKWSQIRQHGYMRDHERKIMAPMMVLRRTTVTPDERLPKLDLNHYEPSIKIFPYRTFNMQYDRVAGQFVTKPSYEYYLTTTPDYIRVSYELIVWTDLMEQMNFVLQSINVASDHVWGDYHKFRTQVLDLTNNMVNAPGEDRLVKTTINLQVDGWLRQEFEYHQSNIQKQYSIKRIQFAQDRSDHEYFNDPNDIGQGTKHLSEEPLQDLGENLRRNIRYK